MKEELKLEEYFPKKIFAFMLIFKFIFVIFIVINSPAKIVSSEMTYEVINGKEKIEIVKGNMDSKKQLDSIYN